MLSAIFDVRPETGQWDSYLGKSKLLRREIEQLPGFIDNILYKSLTRAGWMLSLTSFQDEQSVLQWLGLMSRLEVQRAGQDALVSDCQLKVGHLTFDTRNDVQAGGLRTGDGEIAVEPAITLTDGLQWPDWVNTHNAEEIALYLGFDLNSFGDCTSWDVFESIYSPGSIMLLASWKDGSSALAHAQSALVPDDARVRAVQAVRSFGGCGNCGDAGQLRLVGDDGAQTWRNASNDR